MHIFYSHRGHFYHGRETVVNLVVSGGWGWLGVAWWTGADGGGGGGGDVF